MKALSMSLIIIVIIVTYLITQKFGIERKDILLEETTIEERSYISIYPKTIYPGDPVFVTVYSTSTPTSIFFNGKKLPIFIFNSKSHALTAIDFNEKQLEHKVEVSLSNGEKLNSKIVVTPREKIVRPLGIPEKLGGNTTEASKTLAANLAKENYEINSIISENKLLWSLPFGSPLTKVFVTDDYGYDRKTVDRTIVHKGTDFRAATGTPVLAMNKGVVKIARTYIVYGNTIVIDHGFGLQTLYMHLSKLNVKEGDTVMAGDIIGLSGMTGYASAPHLHISVKVGGVSIDPMVFLGFFSD